MKPTFKADKLGRMIPTDNSLNQQNTKRISLRPKSMTRSKSLKRFVLNIQGMPEKIERAEK